MNRRTVKEIKLFLRNIIDDENNTEPVSRAELIIWIKANAQHARELLANIEENT